MSLILQNKKKTNLRKEKKAENRKRIIRTKSKTKKKGINNWWFFSLSLYENNDFCISFGLIMSKVDEDSIIRIFISSDNHLGFK